MESKNIKISVVIPVYNTEEYLGQCLDSLYLQKYREVEYILVDDGSTDDSYALCQKYAAKDERFVVVQKENGGPSSARNLAISMARGEYITFVDSDDFIRVDAYERIAALLAKHDNPDCLIFGANLVPDYPPEHYYNFVTTTNKVYEEFTPEMLYNEPGARPFLWLQVIKKSVITENNITMDESISLGEDQLFQIEVFPHTKKTVFVADKLYYYRWKRQGSLMSENAENKERKLLLHVGLVEKAFSKIFTGDYSEQMKIETLKWSVSFMWGDVAYMLEQPQNLIAASLAKVWRTYNYEAYVEGLDDWNRSRLEQLLLMAVEDKNERIAAFEDAIGNLEAELDDYKSKPEYKKLAKSLNKKESRIKKLFRSLKENGLKQTLKKIKAKLKKA